MEHNDEKTVFANASDSEKTIINNVKEKESGKKVSAEAKPAVSNPAEDKKISWKEVTIGGVSGIALGAAGILFSGFTLPEKSETNATTEDSHDINAEELHDVASGDAQIDVATCVNDDMSFSEAFAAARQEVGANGAFVWHGQVYTTCYAEEWNSLSEAEQSQFSHYAVAAITGNDAQDQGNGDQPYDRENETPATDIPADDIPADDIPADEPNSGDEDIQVSILGVEENVVTEEGDIINVGYADINGHSAIFIDADADGTFDILSTDINDDGYIDVASETEIIESTEFTVQDFQTAIEPDPVDDLYAQTPDYTNDADTSSFA